MSCGLPDPPAAKLPFPGGPVIEVPTIPEVPDHSWAAELGVDLPAVIPKVPGLSVPSVEVPQPPELPDYSWAADLGVSFPIAKPKLPFPGAPPFDLPGLPQMEKPPCPFDEEV